MKHVLKLTVLGLALVAGYAQAQTAAPAVQVGEGRIQYKVYEILDKDMTSINFDNASNKLTAAELQKLSNFVATTKNEAKLDTILVAAWSDKDYPSTGKLSSAEQKLAGRRADAVKAALKKAGASSVSTYNMTERPNWLQKVFSTKTAEVKGGARTHALTNDVVESLGKRLRSDGGPGKVVVVAKFKDEVVSH